MKHLLYIALFLSTFCACQSQSDNKLDSTANNYSFNSPDELARHFYEKLKAGDTLEVYKSFISKNAMYYLIEASAKMNKEKALDEVRKNYEKEFVKAYSSLIRNLSNFIEYKIRSLNDFRIVKIDYRIEDWYNTKGVVDCADIKIKISNEKEQHVLRLSGCGSVKKKWFIIGPEIYFDERKVTENY